MVVLVPTQAEFECADLIHELAREHSARNEDDSSLLDCVLICSSSGAGVKVRLNYIITESVKAKTEKLEHRSCIC